MQSIRDYPVLFEFLSSYWFETADLVYGKAGIRGATDLFLSDWPNKRAKLANDLARLGESPYLRDRPSWTQKAYKNFWDAPGVHRVLLSKDVDTVLTLVADGPPSRSGEELR